MVEVVTRTVAMSRGLKRYFTGTPCKHGHIAERNVCNWECCECSRLAAQQTYHKRRVANPQKVRDEDRRRYCLRRARDPECVKAKNRRNYANNIEKRRAKKREEYQRNREKILGYLRRYREQNRDKYRDYQRNYQKEYGAKVRDLIAVLRREMPELLKEFGL